MQTNRIVAAMVVLMSAAAFAAGCRNVDVNLVFEQISEARRLAADIEVRFAQAGDSVNRAVMADTDERAGSSAIEARRAFDAVEKDMGALAALLRTLGYSDEMRTLAEFSARFEDYRALEEDIIALATEGTNVKARQLSFGPAQRAAAALTSALDKLAPARPADAWHVKALSASAVAAVRDIQVLQAPHIAERTDSVMDDLERRMSASETAARASLKELRPLVAPDSIRNLDAAIAALDQFTQTNADLLVLSRRNTNVRSLAMALEQKHALLGPCQESLRALREQLSERRHDSQRWPWVGR